MKDQAAKLAIALIAHSRASRPGIAWRSEAQHLMSKAAAILSAPMESADKVADTVMAAEYGEDSDLALVPRNVIRNWWERSHTLLAQDMLPYLELAPPSEQDQMLFGYNRRSQAEDYPKPDCQLASPPATAAPAREREKLTPEMFDAASAAYKACEGQDGGHERALRDAIKAAFAPTAPAAPARDAIVIIRELLSVMRMQDCFIARKTGLPNAKGLWDRAIKAAENFISFDFPLEPPNQPYHEELAAIASHAAAATLATSRSETEAVRASDKL